MTQKRGCLWRKTSFLRRKEAFVEGLVFLIKFYRVFLSVHFGGACRFYPSCSCYAEGVFLSYSPLKAWVLILKRLSKCHFFGPPSGLLFATEEGIKKTQPKNQIKSALNKEGILKKAY